MFKWASVIFSSIALALLGIACFAFVAEQGCLDRRSLATMAIAGVDTPPPSPQPHCVMLYDALGGWTFLCGAGLIALLLIAHLIVAAKKRAWGWFNSLLLVSLLCFSCGILYASAFVGGEYTLEELTYSDLCAFIGLLNLLFGIKVLKPTRGAPNALPSAEVTAS